MKYKKKDQDRKKEEQHIGDAIQAYLNVYKLQGRLTEVDLNNAWESIMGKAVANHTTELKIRKNVLIVKLNSSVLRQELMYGREKIARAVNTHFQKKIVDDVLLV